MTSTNCLDIAIELLHCHDLWPVPIHRKGDKIGDKIATGKEPIGTAWGL